MLKLTVLSLLVLNTHADMLIYFVAYFMLLLCKKIFPFVAYNWIHLFLTLGSNVTFVNVQILLLQVCVCLPTCALSFPQDQMSHEPV